MRAGSYCSALRAECLLSAWALAPPGACSQAKGKDWQRVSKSFVRPQYVPVSIKQFESIAVNVKRDTRETVPFEFGRVLLTLHFRRSRPVNFLKDEEASHPKSQVVRTVLLRESQAKRWEFTSFSRCSISARSLFRWAVPLLQQGAKILDKKSCSNGCWY